MNSGGIYRLQCKTCNKSYVGQTGSPIEIRYCEHTRHIKTKNPISAYAIHILNNRQEYSSPEHTKQLLKAYWERKVNELLGNILHAGVTTT